MQSCLMYLITPSRVGGVGFRRRLVLTGLLEIPAYTIAFVPFIFFADLSLRGEIFISIASKREE